MALRIPSPLVLPVAAATSAAIRVRYDCPWNPERYASLVTSEPLRCQARAARNRKSLYEMNELLRQEQQERRIVSRFRDSRVRTPGCSG